MPVKKEKLVPGKHRVKDEREVYKELIEFLEINHKGLANQLRILIKHWRNVDL